MRCLAAFLVLTFASHAAAGEVEFENRVVGVTVSVEVVDSANTKVKTKFDLQPKAKKATDVTGGRVEVTVYEAGSKKKVASGEFPASGTVIIERQGTTWKLRRER